jgi:hypothetical protein
MAAKEKPVVETLGFVNPSIEIPAKGKEGDKGYVAARTIKSPRGYQITNSEKYPVNKFDKMLLDFAEKNGGSAKLVMVCSINLNQKSDEPIDTTGIELLS